MDGFIINFSLMVKVGVIDYKVFVEEVVKEILDVLILFEVFVDDLEIMEKEVVILK